MLPTPQIINNEIGSGEKLLWWGQPQSVRPILASFGIWLFAIPWTAFACFWVYMAVLGVKGSQTMGPIGWAFPLFGLPFILVGLGMLGSPLFVWRKLSSTYYLLTDRRLVVLTDGHKRTSQSYQLDGLTNLVRTEYGDLGDLTWSVMDLPVDAPSGRAMKSVVSSATVTLTGIKEPRKVANLVQDYNQKLLEKRNEY